MQLPLAQYQTETSSANELIFRLQRNRNAVVHLFENIGKHLLTERTLTVEGSITVQLVCSLTDLDSVAFLRTIFHVW